MKNKIKSMVLTLTVFALTTPILVSAATKTEALVIDPGSTGLSNKSLYEIVTTAMQWLLGAVGVLSVIAFAISGVLYLTAAGDDDRIKKAKSVMTTAITGVIVAMIGLIVVTAVNAFLKGGSSSNVL